MTSTRLPGKVLKTANGIPLLAHHVRRLQWSNLPVIIATTVNKEDDPICAFATQHNLPFFRGSENDVLSRFYLAAKENDLDIIVRVTSDCPLIDGKIIGNAVSAHIETENEFLYTSNVLERSFPRGFDFEIFSFKRLRSAFENASEFAQREHVTPYINKNVDGKTEFRHVLSAPDRSDWRITVDTPEDYELIKILFEKHQMATMTYEEIGPILDKNMDLKKINAHIEQKKV
jgi:spore coat polysaccharide biosynthesis protein SpsF